MCRGPSGAWEASIAVSCRRRAREAPDVPAKAAAFLSMPYGAIFVVVQDVSIAARSTPQDLGKLAQRPPARVQARASSPVVPCRRRS